MTEGGAKDNAVLRRLCRGIAFLGLVGLLFLALGITLDVILRAVFDHPLEGLEDINGMVISVVVVAFFPTLLIEQSNVSFDLLGRFLGPGATLWLDAFGHAVTFFFIAVIAWQFVDYAAELGGQQTLILQWPSAPGWWVTAGLAVFCAVV